MPKFTFTYRIPGTAMTSKTNVHADTLEEAIEGFKAKGEKFRVGNILRVKKFTTEYIPFDPSKFVGESHDN